MRDGDGEVVHFVGVQVDVTARRAAASRAAPLDASSPTPARCWTRRSTCESTLASLTRLSVPFLGDVCVVEELRHDEVRRLARAARRRTSSATARDAEPVPATEDDPLVRAVRSGRAEIVSDERLFGRPANAMIVPLKARGDDPRRGGLRARTERGYGHAGPRAGRGPRACAPRWRSTTRACTRTSARSPARSSRACCPQRLPTLPGMDLAARYRPAGDGSLIGGDFYDVLPREDGLDLVIGDVTGKGARAAALTAQVRHTLRTAAQYEATPERGAGRRQPHAAGRARRERALLHGRDVPAGAQRHRARDDLLRRAPDADRDARAAARSSTSASPAPCSAGCRTRSSST